METPNNDIKQLYDQAFTYERLGDVYNAVKLYKLITKRAPDWEPSYHRLGQLYKDRQDWKAALHYNKKTVAINPSNQDAWWNLGIAATALKKTRIAKNIWNKFGCNRDTFSPISIRINYRKQFEILRAQPIDPAKALLINIPHPGSNRRYGDIILYDKEIVGHHIVQRKKMPVYNELGLFKRALFDTYSCILEPADKECIKTLAQLCANAHLGFEVWSNATYLMNPKNQKTPLEYYGNQFLPQLTSPKQALVAIAAKQEKTVLEVLHNWQIISLGHYSNLRCYR